MFASIRDRSELSEDVKLQFNSNIRFTDFPLHHHIIGALLKNGYLFPSPVQYHLLSQEIKDENLVIQAKSGTGKTIAFTVFILNSIFFEFENLRKQDILKPELLALFIAPTREICIQINSTISMFFSSVEHRYSILNFCCIGGNPISEDVARLSVKGPVILTSTPGRFIQLVNHNSVNFISLSEIRNSLIFLLFDEADRLFEDCFLSQTDLILEICLNSASVQFMAFSATFPPEKLILLKYKLREIRTKGNCINCKLRQIQLCSSAGFNVEKKYGELGSIYNEVHDLFNLAENEKSMLSISKMVETPVLKNLRFYLYDISLKSILDSYNYDENDYYQWSYLLNSIIDILIRVPYKQSFIFTNNSSIGYKVTATLNSIGIITMYTSGRRSQIEREQIFASLQKDKCRVVVCSDLLARGIDINKVDLIINIDVPLDKETFLHRAGRSARFGQTGNIVCIPSSKTDYESFIYLFDQLGIIYLNFSDYIRESNHLEKMDGLEEIYIYENELSAILSKSDEATFSNGSFNHVNESKCGVLEELLTSRVCNVDFNQDFYKKVDIVNSHWKATELDIENIDKILISIWRNEPVSLMGTRK